VLYDSNREVRERTGKLDEPEVLKGVHDGHLSDFTHPEDIKDEL
jgi:hypothetical protein